MTVFSLLIVEHEHQRRNGEEVQEVNSYRESHQERYEHDPSVGIRLVSLLIPLGHRPEDHGSEERRHRIYLTLDCREPECVAECVCKGSHCA